MNWIIRNTNKLGFHTNLNILMKPIEKEISNFKWLATDLEINSREFNKLPINHDRDWFLISATEFEDIRKTDTQIIWGIFSAMDVKTELQLNIDNLPFADGNGSIWESGQMQLPDSKIEIIAWDSSYTLIKFVDIELSDKFSAYFDEAIELEKYKF